MLKINGWLKMYEQDEYENGCVPNTGGMAEVDLPVQASDEEGLLQAIRDTFGVDADAIMVDPCGEDDRTRIDVQVTECDDSTQPSASELEAWKRGEMRLWAATYSGHVTQVSDYAMSEE